MTKEFIAKVRTACGDAEVYAYITDAYYTAISWSINGYAVKTRPTCMFRI